MKYKGSASGDFAGMNSYTIDAANLATAMVEVSVPPSFVLWGERGQVFRRYGPAVAQISVSHVVNCEVFAAAVADVQDAVKGGSGFIFTNSYYSGAMRRVTFGVVAFPQSKPGGPADPSYCAALANIFRFTEDTEVAQTTPPPEYYGGGGL